MSPLANLDAARPLPDPCNLCGQPRRAHPPRGCPPSRFAEAVAVSAAAEEERKREAAAAIVAPAPPAAPPRTGDLDVDRVTREAAAFAPGPFGFFLWLEDRLVVAGFPPTSPWWIATLRDFYASGKRWLVVMAGRGAGKSTLLTRVAVVEGLFAPRSSPPGEAWIWPFVSVATKDARRRIIQIARILRALGIDVDPSYPSGQPTIETVDMRGNPIEFVAFASTIAALSGPTSIGATVDEEAKLRGDGSANPSGEVIASLVQTFRARPGIRAIRCSSAWRKEGSHYGAIMAGDTLSNHVARVGAFLSEVLAGLESVAAWEQAQGDLAAARQIRTHALSLKADSPNATTWLGNPTLGNPDGKSWDGAALASRIELETLDAKTFAELFPGMTRAGAWLRECASVPASEEGEDYGEQCILARAITEGLAQRRGHLPATKPSELIKVPGAPMGDARYAGPTPRQRPQYQPLRTRKVM